MAASVRNFEKELQEAVDCLEKEGCSCVIRNDNQVRIGRARGVYDLYKFYTEEPQVMFGSVVADRVVGKGAAAVMVLGGVRMLHTKVISETALQLLREASVDTRYDTLVPYIINRAGTGMCPLESLCRECVSAEEAWPLIRQFVMQQAASV